MPTQAIAPPAAHDPLDGLTADHPLAEVARRHCAGHANDLIHLIADVACGSCWVRALCDDLLFAIEHELPLELVPDLSYVDDVAVERAVHAVRYSSDRDVAEAAAFDSLTEVERVEAKRRLAEIRNRRNQRRTYRFVCSRAAAARREVLR